MRSHALLVLIASTAGCEHVGDLDAGVTVDVPAAVEAPSDPALSVSREPPVAIREYTIETDPSPRRVRLRDLPVPPSDRPRAYTAWLETLSADERADVAAYCSNQRLDYAYVCGGIGPLHIPQPPHIFPIPVRSASAAEALQPRSYFASMESWHASLTAPQRQYFERECEGGEDGAPNSDLCGPNTPIVIAFGNEAIAYTTGGAFAFRPAASDATDWPTATTPWLVLDRDGDGAIASGRELFGGNTLLADGQRASNGFAALSELDDNRDGRIDRDDRAFARLQLWADRNSDQHADAGELSAASTVLVSISLAVSVEVRCDDRANCERERAAVTWRDALGSVHTGSAVDIYLPAR